MGDLFNLDFSRWGITILFLLPALVNIGIFIYVFFFLPLNRVNLIFAIFAILIGLWLFFDGVVRLSLTAEVALAWTRVSLIFFVFVLPIGILFTIIFSGWERKITKVLFFCTQVVPACIYLFLTTAHLDSYTAIKSEIWYWVINPEPTTITSAIYLWITLEALLMLALLWFIYFKSAAIKRKQSLLLAVGFSVPVIGGLTAEVLFPLILGISSIPITTPLFTAFSVAALIAIKRYQFLDYSPIHQWDQIIESMNEGILIVNNQDEIMYANPILCQKMGYTFNEINGKVAKELFFDNEQDKDLLNRENKLRIDKKSSQYEIQLKTKSGDKIWMIINGSPYMDKNGKVIGSIGMLTDISALKKAESLFKALVEYSNNIIYLVDKEGKITYVSPALERITGYTSEEMKGKPTFAIVHPDHLEESKQAIKKVIQNPGVSFPRVNRFVHKNGHYVWVEGVAINLLNDQNVQSIVAAFHDITERVEANEKIEKSNAELNIAKNELEYSTLRLKQAQSIAHVGNWEMNFSTGITFWSDESRKIYGITDEKEEIEETFLSYIHPDDLVYVKSEIKKAKANLNDSSFYHRIIRPNGEIRHVHSESKFEFNASGKPIGLYGTVLDVTELKLAEKQALDLVSHLQQKNKELQQFAYIVSHNLRAPIANVLSLVELGAVSPNEKINDMTLLECIESEVANLDTVIMDLNTIISARDLATEHKEYVNFENELLLIKELLSTQIKLSNATISHNFQDSVSIQSVKSYIYSIILNLVSNAIKYRSIDRALTIHLETTHKDNFICLSVKDNGMGIDLQKYGDKIFGLYKRFHGEKIDGKGIGLHLVKVQIESLGGRIEVESKVNEGTIFKVFLPISNQSNAKN